MNRIDNLEQLKKESGEDGSDFIIVLGSGCAKSSKQIRWFKAEKVFSIYNEIDDTMQELTEAQIMDESRTLIGKAMKNKRLFKY